MSDVDNLAALEREEDRRSGFAGRVAESVHRQSHQRSLGERRGRGRDPSGRVFAADAAPCEACDTARGVGAVLWGEAGIGKSHLLSRLGRWANRENQACFVYLHNLQAAPEHLPRSLLHAVVSNLTRGRQRQFVGSTLFDLVHAGLLDAVNHQMGNYTWPKLERAYAQMIDGIAGRDLPGATLIDHTVWDVLFRFFRSVYRANQGKEDGTVAALAVRWLAGQARSEEARTLELPPAQGPTRRSRSSTISRSSRYSSP